MKRILFIALLIFCTNSIFAQGLGEIYDKNGLKGIVVKLASDGTPSVIMSLQRTNDKFYYEKELEHTLYANDRNDGRKNMAAIEQYISQYGGEFPIYNWCKSLGEGWYLPAINEVYDAWISVFGGEGALDNYDQDLFLAIEKRVKSHGGDKLAYDKNQPRGMTSSTFSHFERKGKTTGILLYVDLKESVGSTVGTMLSGPWVHSRKGGKISTAYFPISMKGGLVSTSRAFYRLKDDAYEAGIYPAPDPLKGLASDIGAEAATSLQNVDEVKGSTSVKLDDTRESKKNDKKAEKETPSKQQSQQNYTAHPQQHNHANTQPQQQNQVAQQQYQQAAQPQNNGQYDLIICSGEDIKCKVIKVGQKEIEYKRIDNLDGPTYTISRKKAIKIKYANGFEEDVKTSLFDFIKK